MLLASPPQWVALAPSVPTTVAAQMFAAMHAQATAHGVGLEEAGGPPGSSVGYYARWLAPLTEQAHIADTEPLFLVNWRTAASPSDE